MRCPICGAKMVNKQLCQYCNITDEQIYNASNKKVNKISFNLSTSLGTIVVK